MQDDADTGLESFWLGSNGAVVFQIFQIQKARINISNEIKFEISYFF